MAVGQLGTRSAEPLLRGVADCADPTRPAKAPLAADLDAAAKTLADAYAAASPDDRPALADALSRIAPARFGQLPDGRPAK